MKTPDSKAEAKMMSPDLLRAILIVVAQGFFGPPMGIRDFREESNFE